jgi:peptide/nickel transport system ATP-binding protein
VELLEAVRIRDAAGRLTAYPHQLSGGMCQRVMIAVALACRPRLMIADEPTTGLDVTTQAAVMDLLAEVVARERMALVLITHDLGLAAQYCGHIAVMERGLLVEEAPPGTLFGSPGHAYTRRLVAASPRRDSTLESITEDGVALPPAPAEGPVLLEVTDLVKRFDAVAAVKGVSFSVHEGESLGLVGESGSGKSTISRIVCRLLDASAGSVRFGGAEIGGIAASGFHRTALRRDIQIVFQDPGDSLNPRFSAADSIADPLRRLLGMGDGAEIRARVEALASRVGLEAGLLERFPHQLSGGQKARVGIARAIAAGPRLLVLDEPTAALDVSVQAVVLRLLERLRRESGMAFLFVSHDLNVVRMMCRRTVVLQDGAVVEEGLSEAVLDRPRAEYTQRLVAAIPHFSPELVHG